MLLFTIFEFYEINDSMDWSLLGGCCKICESVEHYQRDCPDLQSQQGKNEKYFLNIPGI